MVIYFCCMFIYLIKMCVGKYAMVYLHYSFQRDFKNVTTSTISGWLYFLFFLFGILFNVCTNLSEFSSFFMVCCTGWTLEILYVYISISRFWKNLAMVWHMSAYYGLVSCLTLWIYKLSAWRKNWDQSQAEQKGMEEKDVCAETGGEKTIIKSY